MLRLVQSVHYRQLCHGARAAGADRTLCGYRIGRSWLHHGARWMTPPYPHVSCKHCRRVLAAMTDAEQAHGARA